MLTRNLTDDEVADARTRVKEFTHGPDDVSDEWLQSISGTSIIESTANSPDPGQSRRMANAMRGVGEERCIGVATEWLNGTDETFQLHASAADIDAFSYETAGLNYALIPTKGLDWVFLCTAENYLIVAGIEAIVRAFAVSPASSAAEFRSFADGDPIWQSPSRASLYRHLRWAESRGS